MTTEQKFHAAVNVIRSLPKSGSYQPSNETMLKFYSYFKQATEGKCNIPKPSFWDIVGRAKWDAWKNLGEMPPNKAMESYVTELQKIVETMAYTDNVAAFVDTVADDFPPIPKEDLELVAGAILKKFKTSSSTESSQDNSPARVNGQQNGHYESDDEFIDTVDSDESEIPITTTHVNENGFIPNGKVSSYDHSKTIEINNRVLEEIRKTVSCLEKDMVLLKEKVFSMEKNQRKTEKNILSMRPVWWPFPGVSPAFLVFFFLWPIVANKLVVAIRRKRSP